MLAETVFFSDGQRMGAIRAGRVLPLTSQRYVKYLATLRDIRRQHQWKSSGTGAAFLGVRLSPEETGAEPLPQIGGMALRDGLLYYTIYIDGVGSLYAKDPLDDQKPEGVVVSRQGMATFGLAWNGASFATTAAEGPQRHLGFFTLPQGELTVVTEGDTVESTPSWSRDCQKVYFSSAGFGRDAGGAAAGLGPRAVCRLDPNTMELTEVYSHPDYDCLAPQEGEDGRLWFIRRPRQGGKDGNPVRDVVLAPVRIAKAVGGWLDFFTQRYAGESLRSGGDAKSKRKSDKELFIEGNLINVEKTLEENRSKGEPYPGIAPRSWELVRLSPGGEPEVARRGVLAYALCPGGAAVLSDGRHILRRAPDGRETLLAEEPMVTILSVGEADETPAEES